MPSISYKKTKSIIGPAGPTGPTGPAGPAGPQGNSGYTKIPLTFNQETNENFYVVVGGATFSAAEYIGKNIKFVITGVVYNITDFLYARLVDVSSDTVISELYINSETTSFAESPNLTLPNSNKVYEIQIKNGGSTPNYVKLLSAVLDIS